MNKDEEANEDKETTQEQDPSEAAASGPGSASIDEPTEPVLEDVDDAAFRDGVPEPGTGEDDGS